MNVGCQRAEEIQYRSSAQVKDLSGSWQKAVVDELNNHTGTYAKPKLLTDYGLSLGRLKHGQAVYQKRCVQCHGVSGGGDGPAANAMYPRPRDYRKGIYKFTSTPYGSKPLRSDLVRTVVRGVKGTSMPSFKLLPEEDIEAVVDYVLVLTHRGELEAALVPLAEAEEQLDEYVPEEIEIITNKWEAAASQVMRPLTPQPVKFTKTQVEDGRKAFLKEGCNKCHGDDGRGQTSTKDPPLKDSWGYITRAADLTSGMLHGGQEPMDIYRRIYGGINGTPMPSFANALKARPDTIWDMVAYVLYVSNRRRMGESSLPGPIEAYVPADKQPAPE